MTWGQMIVFAISAVLFIATEFLFERGKDTAAKAATQKHFWAAILFVFGAVFGLLIEGSLASQTELRSVKEEIANHERHMTELGQFHELHDLFDSGFANSQPALKGWANDSLAYLRRSWQQGWMPLPKEETPARIAQIYDEALRTIVATNVGSTDFYFTEGNYVSANKRARDRSIAVVRFYLYSDNNKDWIVMHDGKHPASIDDFYNEVKYLHSQMHSLYSVLIDVNKVKLADYWDLLIMDNKFVAKTELSPKWQAVRGLATENEDRLNEVRHYLDLIQGPMEEKYIQRMEPEEVKMYFKSPPWPPFVGGDPADSVFHYVMQQLTGHP
jgi:hypothetical protein